MPLSKNESQQPIKDSDDVTADYRFVGITPADDFTIPYGDLSGAAPNKGLLQKIHDDLQATYTSETINADSIKYISLGDATVYQYIVLRYTAVRGSLKRGGTIEVFNDGTTVYANDSFLPFTDDDSWLVCSLNYPTGSQVQIELTTSDVDGSDTTFKYRIIERIPI